MRKLNKNKTYLLPLLLIMTGLLVCSEVDGSAAWLQLSQKLSNHFFAPVVDIEIVKESASVNYSIQNKSNTTVFIRAEVIGTLKNIDGSIVSSVNAGTKQVTDFIVSMNLGNAWKQGSDGYFYYVKPVKVDEETVQLFKPESTYTSKYKLNIYAQAVLPEDVGGAWGASLDESLSSLTPP